MHGRHRSPLRSYDLFLSYSHAHTAEATILRESLEARGFTVFQDYAGIRSSDQWVLVLQRTLETCSGFVLLVGEHGIEGWMVAEAQVALNRHFGRRDEHAPPPQWDNWLLGIVLRPAFPC